MKALLTAITEHGLVVAWTQEIVPTLQAVGRKRETPGEKYVEVERLLSWHVSGALRCSTPHPAAARAGATPVLACVPGRSTPCRWKCRPRSGCGRRAVPPPAGRRPSTSQPWSGVRGARRRPVVLTLGPGWAGQAAGPARSSGLAGAVAALEPSASS
ncbi:transcriptional regulator [Streptomyces sp. NPDC015184]|uniref:transcriptional regulator n=1 Tax=Streptomyces sp. NPDC015184 TaxID=3364946 RepID=UPI00370340AC